LEENGEWCCIHVKRRLEKTTPSREEEEDEEDKEEEEEDHPSRSSLERTQKKLSRRTHNSRRESNIECIKTSNALESIQKEDENTDMMQWKQK